MTMAPHGNTALDSTFFPTLQALQLTLHMFCQVVEAKEAGAAGVIGVVANVLGDGSPIMTSFAAGIGLDAPLEVLCD